MFIVFIMLFVLYVVLNCFFFFRGLICTRTWIGLYTCVFFDIIESWVSEHNNRTKTRLCM